MPLQSSLRLFPGARVPLRQATFPTTHLLQKEPEQPEAEPPEAVPLQQLKQVDAQLLKSQAKVALVHKGIMQAHDVVLVVGVQAAVEEL